MRYLSAEEILRLHYQVVKDYGGSHGIRDEAAIDSIVTAPKQKVFGQEQYIGIHRKAAVYFRNIISNHAFIDGNKRTAVTVAGIFLKRNGYRLTATPSELEDFAVKVADTKPSINRITAWLKAHTDKA